MKTLNKLWYSFWSLFLLFVITISFSYAEVSDLDDGLISYFSFDVDQDDEVGTVNGTLINTPTFTSSDCILGNCYDFLDSSSEYIDYGNPDSLKFNQSSWTISVWANIDEKTGDHAIVYRRQGSNQWRYGLTSRTGDDPDEVFITNDVFINSLSNSAEDTYYHYVIVSRGSGNLAEFYRNTISQGTDTLNTAVSDPTDTNTDVKFTVGRLGNHNGFYFDGHIDEIGIWNRSLSISEIERLYNDGNALGLADLDSDYCDNVVNTTDLLFCDDFNRDDSTTIGNNWSESEPPNTDIDILNETMFIEDNVNGNEPDVFHCLGTELYPACNDIQNLTEMRFDFKRTGLTLESDFYIRDSSGNIFLRLRFISGQTRYVNSTSSIVIGGWSDGGAFREMIINDTNYNDATYDIYQDDVLVFDNAPFYDKSVSNDSAFIHFEMNPTHQSYNFTIDNVSVEWNPDLNPPTFVLDKPIDFYNRRNNSVFGQRYDKNKDGIIVPFDGEIKINASENISSCNINQANWNLVSIVGDIITFNHTTFTEGDFDFTVNCNDTNDNTGSINFHFDVTLNKTGLTLIEPINDTTINVSDFGGNITFNITDNFGDNLLIATGFGVNDSRFGLGALSPQFKVVNATNLTVDNYTLLIGVNNTLFNPTFRTVVFELIEFVNISLPEDNETNVTGITSIEIDLSGVEQAMLFFAGSFLFGILLFVGFFFRNHSVLFISTAYGLMFGLWIITTLVSFPNIIGLGVMTFSAYIMFITYKDKRDYG